MTDATVLLLHAFPLDARMWSGVAEPLEDVGYAVAAPDLPGPEPLLGFPAWARRVLEHEEGPIVPVGCSMGGYLAFELWRQAPERIRALALLDTRAAPDSPEQQQARDDTITLLGEAGREPFWADLAPKVLAREVSAQVEARARELVLEQPVTNLVATLETLRDRPDSRPTLATIDVPVLVALGEEDAVTPLEEAEAMVAALADARLVVVPRAGHLAPLERPEAVADALLAFLPEVAP